MLREHWRVWLVTILAAFAFIILIIDNMSSIHAGRPTKSQWFTSFFFLISSIFNTDHFEWVYVSNFLTFDSLTTFGVFTESVVKLDPAGYMIPAISGSVFLYSLANPKLSTLHLDSVLSSVTNLEVDLILFAFKPKKKNHLPKMCSNDRAFLLSRITLRVYVFKNFGWTDLVPLNR